MNRSFAGLLALVVLIAAASCGPTRHRPKEADVSLLPPDVLASFRRWQPNSIVLGTAKVRDDGKDGLQSLKSLISSTPARDAWRINYFTPRAEKEWVLYTPEGDKIRSSE